MSMLAKQIAVFEELQKSESERKETLKCFVPIDFVNIIDKNSELIEEEDDTKEVVLWLYDDVYKALFMRCKLSDTLSMRFNLTKEQLFANILNGDDTINVCVYERSGDVWVGLNVQSDYYGWCGCEVPLTAEEQDVLEREIKAFYNETKERY